MGEKPIKIEIIESNTEKEKNTLEDASRLTMQIKSNSDYDMGICIKKASEETGWGTKEIAKSLAIWDKHTNNHEETLEEKEERDIKFGIAERKVDNSVEYLDNNWTGS